MNSQIESWRVQQYAANVLQLAQQKGSRVAPLVRKETFTGKAEFFDRLGLATAQQKTSRNEDTPNLDITHSRRMVVTNTYHWGTLVDKMDKVQNIHMPENEYAVAASNALGRKLDDVLIDAALKSAATGEDGSGTTALGDAQRVAPIASGAQSKLNVQALRRTKRLMDAAEVEGARHLLLNSSQLENLLSETETTSSDFAAVKALVRGEIDTFMGFLFHRTERLIASSLYASAFVFSTSTGLYSGGGTAINADSVSAVAFAEGALIMGQNPLSIARVEERADKGYSTQVYNAMNFGGVRMQETAVVEIICRA